MIYRIFVYGLIVCKTTSRREAKRQERLWTDKAAGRFLVTLTEDAD